MADNYLITGYWGEPHVTAENDRGINAAIFGAGRFVLPVGEQFKAEYIGNNTIRMYDGKLIDNGAAAGIPAGQYIDLVISSAGQGMKRNDLIVFQYSKNDSTLVESGVFTVVKGTETSGTAVDPDLTHSDLLSDEATFDQMALWRVPVSAATINAPEIVYTTKNVGERIVNAHSVDGAIYTANIPGITNLYSGFEITIIPDTTSTTTAPTLNVNGLGAKPIRLSLSQSNSLTTQPKNDNYFAENRPFKVMFDPNWLSTGMWRVVNKQRPSAVDLYGAVPIENGGTGADDAITALKNLIAENSGDTLPDAGNKGRVFFKKVSS